jgi:hypothetical protein
MKDSSVATARWRAETVPLELTEFSELTDSLKILRHSHKYLTVSSEHLRALESRVLLQH